MDSNRVFPIFALVFVDVLGLTILLPLLHLYGAQFGASPLEIGLIAAAFPLAQLIGVPMMGALSDRFGRKPLLLVSQITTFASFIMLGLANSLLLVILSRVLDGVFGANLATAQAALSDVTDEENRARGLGLTGAAFGLGFIFGPIISLVALQFTDDLAIPAFIAAVYSFVSILLTLFVFTETLPPEQRGANAAGGAGFSLTTVARVLRNPSLNVLLVLMFAQQVIFFGFESLLGLFVLTRLGLLGQGNAVIFLVVGIVLVLVQVRMIGPWTKKYGERKLVFFALGLLSVGLILTALTPEQPHPLYVQQIAANNLLDEGIAEGTEAIIGEFSVDLPSDDDRGIGGVLWLLVAVVPLSVGAGLIRPSLNSLLTKRAQGIGFGGVLGVSQSFVSAANAVAPLIGGLAFQAYGATAPFLVGGVLMGVLLALSMALVQPAEEVTPVV
jgi:MFS transporter, DHA1 family, tetracycline resistance protein